MFAPLTHVLLKIFVKEFYRVHSGLLLSSFVSIVMYCFFVEVLNQTHVPPDQVIFYQLTIVLTILSSPVVVGMVFIVWFVLTVKSWSFVSGQIRVASNQFLLYSSTAMSKVAQWRSWFMVQLLISLPVVLYGLFTLIIGVVFGYYIIPVIILSYVVLLASVSAMVYVRKVNVPVGVVNKTFLWYFLRGWRKPFFTLFLYHVLDKLKVTLLITKLLSCGIIAGGFYLLADVNSDTRVAGIIALGVVVTHSILIYHSYRFENVSLSFARNFPYSKRKHYYYTAIAYLLLTSPESVWFIIQLDLVTAVGVIVLNLGTAMLFRNLLYRIAPDMRKYLWWVFGLFIILFALILLKLLWLMMTVNLIVSIVLFGTGFRGIQR
jgi:hypothetical protein